MKNRIVILFLLTYLSLTINARAQNVSDMRINEILSINTDDFVDDYGNKRGWIELFNNSYGTVNIAGCFLSNDRNDLQKYMIPKGDVLTQIKPRQHVLFWADNQAYRGTFHINFSLLDGDRVYFVSNDGHTIIDSIVYPHLDANVSYGRADDGIGAWQIMKRTTPSTNNVTLDSSKALHFGEIDPYGIIMAVIAMGVVFIALILLYFIFREIGRSSIKAAIRKTVSAVGHVPAVVSGEEDSGEVYAAIATAIELYRVQEEAHDIENTILTISRVARTYSPWSSKLYGLRDVPKKK